MASRGRLLCKSDCIEVYDEKNTAFLLICDLSKCFPHEFMVNIVLIRGNWTALLPKYGHLWVKLKLLVIKKKHT